MCRPRRAPLPEMPTSKGQGAKRAFVATLKALGAKLHTETPEAERDVE